MRVAVLHDLAAAERAWPVLAAAIRGQGTSATVVTGNATPYGADEHTRLQTLDRLLDWLAQLDQPVYVLPGRADVPERAVLLAIANHEITHARVQLVHGLPAFLDGEYVVCGYGGDLLETEGPTQEVLAYPRWRAELALHGLRRLDQLRLLLFHGGPASSTVIAHLIKEYAPRLACVGGEAPETRWVGSSLVVVPGAAHAGRLAVVDLVQRRAELLTA
jgi:Icc-related predicted phosphoesterase